MKASRKLPRRFRVGDWVSFEYGPRRITAQIVEDRGALGVQGRRLYRIRPMPSREDSHDFELAEEELELATPPDAVNGGSPDAGTAATPRSFDVVYIRQGNTKNWHATTKPTTGHGAVNVQGAVGYTSAKWEGESEEERFAIVKVLADTRRTSDGRSILTDVRKSADEMFKQKHPDAVIAHQES
jgi:hypothetical protein